MPITVEYVLYILLKARKCNNIYRTWESHVSVTASAYVMVTGCHCRQNVLPAHKHWCGDQNPTVGGEQS